MPVLNGFRAKNAQYSEKYAWQTEFIRSENGRRMRTKLENIRNKLIHYTKASFLYRAVKAAAGIFVSLLRNKDIPIAVLYTFYLRFLRRKL